MDASPTTPDALHSAPVIVIGGAPGSGKTSIGKLLARSTGAALLDQDTLTNPLIAQIAALTGAGDDLDHPSLRGEVRAARYACLRDAAAEISGLGCPVVVVAPFTSEIADPIAWQQFSGMLSGTVLVAVSIDPAESLRRRRMRGLARDGTVAVGSGRAPGAEPGLHVDLVVDGAGFPEELAEQIRAVAELARR
ncbi:AAA family ATPase [Nakamurella sp. A5-74]|uniref:AAA family ATPase n=1 Tax=Nakamurella sp. A5-74 TaxID=3158264 RepID=A0AAU8DQQ5_9ACTN